MKEKLISQIIAIEWDMFGRVQNIGGRASCQDEYPTFSIMRNSQFLTWDVVSLESYLADLHSARQEGRNLLSEKYARMMKYTAPSEYNLISGALPPLSFDDLQQIEQIAALSIAWTEDAKKVYPRLYMHGRPVNSYEDTLDTTSIETYLRGELATYSSRTRQLYYRHLLELKANNRNESLLILENTVKAYGYSSLSEAEQRLAN
ncbi:MAG: DUF4125 family protein [Christensenellales bacterium]